MRQIFLFVLLSLALAVPSSAQEKKPVKPEASPSKAVLDSWNDIGRKLSAMAEDFPEDKYDFKATPAQRSFAENLLHAAGVNYYFTNIVRGEKPPADGENPPRSKYKTKAEIAAFVKKSFADGAAAIVEPVLIKPDFTNLQRLTREEQQKRLAELAQRGESIAAVYMARRLYGCGLEEAQRMIEDLKIRRSANA